MTTARTKLLVQILATLGVSSAACGKEAIVAPDTASDAIKECPDSKGHYAVWPNDDKPNMSTGINDVCLPKPESGKCSSYTSKCVLSRFQCGLSTSGETVLDTIPSSSPEACCWKVKGGCAIGRPFVVDGAARVAPLEGGAGWKGVLSLALPEDTRARAALADVWARDGLTEHASVASFAQLVLDLLALGAPADLIRGAQEAMGDEIRHAERAFALASAYAGADVAPGALDTRGVATRSPDLADFAARTASEACIAETIAALQLHAAADAATDETLAELLRLTANEEAVHALLGYRIVRWAIAQGGERVRGAVMRVFDEAATHVGFGPLADDALDLHAHGVLSRRARHDLALEALAAVITPAARALLESAASART